MVDVALSILHSAASNLAVDSAPGDEPIYHPLTMLSHPGGSLKVTLKIIKFQTCPCSSKVMQIEPKATQSLQNLTLKSTEFQLL